VGVAGALTGVLVLGGASAEPSASPTAGVSARSVAFAAPVLSTDRQSAPSRGLTGVRPEVHGERVKADRHNARAKERVRKQRARSRDNDRPQRPDGDRRQHRQRSQQANNTAPAVPSDPRQIAAGMLGAYGWDASQFSCLDALWVSESDWNPYAENPTSGAYGIPQSLPPEKMASAGADWRTNPVTQISWGLEYISLSYGTPCGAWAFKQANNWY
jgi:hypothetical protein